MIIQPILAKIYLPLHTIGGKQHVVRTVSEETYCMIRQDTKFDAPHTYPLFMYFHD